jgi:DNA-binding transcriptional regulator YiaG
MKVSQAVFAGPLNISVKTVQAWEQGNGSPSGPSLGNVKYFV